MATHRLPIHGGLAPDSSGKVWWEPFDVLATNDVWRQMVLRIDEAGANNAQLSTRAGAYGEFFVPKNYVDAASLIIVWGASITTGGATVVWDCDYRAVGGNDTESLDQAGNQESVTGSDDVASAAWERLELSIDLTDGNFAVDDTVLFFICNDGTDGTDDAACARILFQLFFQYEDA